MSHFNLLAATRTIEQTMGFALYRFLICFGIGLGYLVAALAGAGTLVGFASLAKNASAIGPFGAILGFGLFAYLMWKTRPFWLYALKAPHLAVLAAQAKGEPLPSGKALVDFAKQRLQQSFPKAQDLFEQDLRIRQNLAEIAEPATAALAPAAQPPLKKFLVQAFGTLYGRNHQTILAWYFYSGAAEYGPAADAALGVQKLHCITLLKYRLYAAVFEVLGFLIAFPVLLLGIQALIADIPIAFGMWPYVFAGVFAWTLKAAFLEPIAEAAMMASFFPLAEREAVREPGSHT